MLRYHIAAADVVYQGDHTKYWVTIADDWKIALTRQHTRFMLDEKPITWNDHVFVYWFADDGFMTITPVPPPTRPRALLPDEDDPFSESDLPVDFR